MKHWQAMEAHDCETVCGGTPDDEPTLFPVPPLQPSPAPVELPPERKKKDVDWTLPMPFAGGAEISPCGHYRYSLYRRWEEGGKKILFIGVNPSTADAALEDATTRRWASFAKRDGYGEFWAANVCAYRATNPKALKSVADYQDVQNREYIRRMADSADKIVACWGNNVELVPYWNEFAIWLCEHYDVYCFGRTKAGHPKHPLRLSADTLYSKYYHQPATVTVDVIEKPDDAEFVCESETTAMQELSDEEFTG